MRASDITVSHDVEIVNLDHVIAHVSAGGKIVDGIEGSERGRGYVPGNVRSDGEMVRVLAIWFSTLRSVRFAA